MSKFITFEGIDGSGKTTQISLLSSYLSENGIDNIVIREPGNTILSEQIRELLLSNKSQMDSKSELLLFEAARANLVDSFIKPTLESGKIVISDRFYDSTTAYQGYGRQLDKKTIQELNNFATSGLTPDLTIYLKVSLSESKKRSQNKNKDRMELAGDEFFKRVITGFNTIASEEPERVKVIESKHSITRVHKEIINFVKKIL